MLPFNILFMSHLSPKQARVELANKGITTLDEVEAGKNLQKSAADYAVRQLIADMARKISGCGQCPRSAAAGNQPTTQFKERHWASEFPKFNVPARVLVQPLPPAMKTHEDRVRTAVHDILRQASLKAGDLIEKAGRDTHFFEVEMPDNGNADCKIALQRIEPVPEKGSRGYRNALLALRGAKVYDGYKPKDDGGRDGAFVKWAANYSRRTTAPHFMRREDIRGKSLLAVDFRDEVTFENFCENLYCTWGSIQLGPAF